MSFPSFVHEELRYETWEDSDLLGRLNRLLVVPIRRSKGQPQDEGVVGRAFFWSPSETELRGIEKEWERYRSLIASGLARRLPTARETTYIHVRPKARDARDRDIAPGGFDVIKKCFWLNSDYVERIIGAHRALR
jgi:DNA mismatch repair protein MutH